MIVRPLKILDCQEIANLHEEAFKFFFLTSLGNNFLRIFYYSILKHKNGIGLGLFMEEKLVAFAIGTRQKSGFYSSLLLVNMFRFVRAVFFIFFHRPKVIMRIWKSVLTSGAIESGEEMGGALLSICVKPSESRKGYGYIILKEFEKEIFSLSDTISLTTDANGNDIVNNFYQQNGYKLDGQFNQGKRLMNLYSKKIKTV